jgi:molybdate transport system permease protein
VRFQPLLLSLQIAAVATVLCALVGVSLGGLLAARKLPANEWVAALFTAPLVLPPTVLGYYVLVALGRRSPIGMLWESLTGSSIVFTRTGAVVAAALGGMPLAIRSSRAALEGVDPLLVAAARTLGAGPLRAFATVQLPLARQGIAAGLTLAFARALGDFGVTLMVAGDIPGETQTASLAVYDAIQAGRDGDALGMVVVLTAAAVVALRATARLGAPI